MRGTARVMPRLRKLVAVSALASVTLFGVACSDEDGDGGTTDEEINQLDENVEDGVEQGEQELEEGRDEIDDSDQQNDDDN